jgi:hypothetical protein
VQSSSPVADPNASMGGVQTDLTLREQRDARHRAQADAMIIAALEDPGKGPAAQAEALKRIAAAQAYARGFEYEELSPQMSLVEAILAKTEHVGQWEEEVSWPNDTTAAMICHEFISGTREPPDLSDREMTSTTLEHMSHGILAEPKPSEDVLDVVTLAASRHDPVIIFCIMAGALRVRYEHEDYESTWADIANSLAFVLARAKDEDLVIVPRSTSAVDELAQEGTDVEAADRTPAQEWNHAQPDI